jgi:enoyl-CoA hydratase/carnithine racemase
MEFEDIRIEVVGRVGTLMLNRPHLGNAVRGRTLEEFCQAIDRLTQDRCVGAIVIAAEGKHFCAGAELSFLDDLTTRTALEIQNEVYTHFQGAAKRLYHCPKPTVAAVSGAALTVGCELALACDFRLADDTANFAETWIKLGAMPPLGGLFLLPHLVGLGRASEMVLRGRSIKGEEAYRIGLVSELVAASELASRAQQLAEELAAGAPAAYTAVKEALHRGMESSMDREWAANMEAQSLLLSSDDFREGLAAAKEKRSPAFRDAASPS